MTIRSVIDIDINDAAFTKFHALFDKYQAALAKTPGDWKKVGDVVGGTALTVESLVAGLAAQTEATRRAAAEQKKAADEAKRRSLEEAKSAEFWRKSATNAKDMAKSIGGMTLDLLKWGSAAAAFTGVAGAGAFFGLDALALNVGSGRRSAQGLGVRYGEQRSFETNYGRLVDPSAFLGGVNESLTDVSKRSALYGAGLSEGQLAGKDTAQVAAILIPALKALADRTPTSQLGQLLQSRQLGNLGISVQDLERLKVTKPGELSGISARYNANVGTFDLEDATQRKWQDFAVTLTAAKLGIENVFVKGLTPLVPALEKFSGSIVTVLTSFFSNPHLSKDIEDFGKGIESFATYLGGKQFQIDIKSFADNVSYAAEKLAGVARFLGLLPSESANITPDRAPGIVKGALAGGVAGAAYGVFGGPIGAVGGALIGGALGALFTKGSQSYLLDAIGKVESNNNPNARSSKGALGMYQMLPGTAAQYHVGNPFDANAERVGAYHYINDLSKEFGGDIRKVLAAYNWGQGNVEKDIRSHGADWERYAPAETRSYINKVLSAVVKAGASVTINNNTGGNAVVQANQASK